MARKRGLPKGGRYTSAGRITIQVTVMIDGVSKRVAHSKVLPSEPLTYEDEAAAWAGRERIDAYLKNRSALGVTLADFWAKWSDPDHWWNSDRSEPTMVAYTARTRAFVERYGELPMAAITEAQLDEYREAGGLLSHVGAISRIFHDATRRNVIPFNPLAQAAREASKEIAKRTRAKRVENPPPSVEQVEAMLERLKAPGYPASLYGWFLTGADHGMRGGEIDGMEWSELHGDVYWIKRQWNARVVKTTGCKHGSERKLKLTPRLMDVINAIPHARRGRYIWTDLEREHWSHGTRDYWWTWTGDGGPSLRDICGGVTMYNATRHYWASCAVNIWGLTPYQASLLYGHSDGGVLITKVYCNPDHERAMQAAYEAAQRHAPKESDVVNLDDYRKGDDDDAAGAAVS